LLGGAGTDTLDYSAYNSGVSVDLSSGTATGVTWVGQFEILIGSEYNDTLIGDDNDNIIYGLGGDDTIDGKGGNDTFVFAGAWGNDTVVETAGGGNDTLDFTAVTAGLLFTIGDGYGVSDGLNTVIHAGRFIEILRGGQGNDTFAFTGSGSVSGTIDGQGGSNTLDYSGYGTAVTVDLQNSTATGLGSFSSIQALTGSSYADTLIGPDTDTVFRLTAAGTGTVNDSFSFAGIENLRGGSAADRFEFADGVTLAGSVDGGAGSDTLDYSAYLTPATMVLTGLGGIDVFAGTATAVGGTFTNIDRYVGSAGAGDVLTGLDEDTIWNLEGFKLYASGDHQLELSGVETLRGGNADDTFIIRGPVNFFLDGGAGNNTLDYSQYGSGVTMDLQTMSITGLIGFANIQNFRGSNFNDTIIGPDDGATFSITAADAGTVSGSFGSFSFTSVEILLGGAGNDTFALSGNGSISGRISGLEIIYTGSGDDSFLISGANAYQLYSGAGDDTFRFAANGTLTGLLDGGSGYDTLDYSGDISSLLTVRIFALEREGSIDGFDGREGSTLPGGFANIDAIVGGLGMDTLQGPVDRQSEFHIYNDRVEYRSGSRVLTTTFVENLVGGVLDDTFFFHGDAQLPGDHNSIDGQGGRDTLDYSDYDRGDNSGVGVGGGGDDVLSMADGAVLAGSFDGQGGMDTLDFSNVSNDLIIRLGEVLGYADGFTGTITGLTDGFCNVDAVLGGSGRNSFFGRDAAAVFDLTVSGNTYTDTLSNHRIAFAGFADLYGGELGDVFNISAVFTGNLFGLGGDDSFNFLGAGGRRSIRGQPGRRHGQRPRRLQRIRHRRGL